MKVTLKSVTLKSSGSYKCEVSAEAPSFSSGNGNGYMEVVCKCFQIYIHRSINTESKV